MAYSVPSANTGDVYELGGSTLLGAGPLTEQLMNVIYNIDPFDNPVVAMLPREKANGVLDQWMVDSLPNISVIETGVIEGADFDDHALVTPTRLTNVTMILRADVKVSGTAEAVELAGISDLYGFHVGKFTKTIGNKLERVLLDPSVATATGSASAARVLKNFNSFLTTQGAAVIQDLPAGTNVTAISEDDFNDGLQEMWENGARTRVAVVDAGTMRQVQAAFLGISKAVTDVTLASAKANRLNIMADAATLYASVEFYKSPFGMVTFVLDRWLPNTSNANSRIYMIDREYASIAWLRPLKHKFLGDVGDSTRGIVLGEMTLRVKNPKAHYMFRGTA